MGGCTKVESKIGVGTKFIINIKTKCKVNNKNQTFTDLFCSNQSKRNDQEEESFVFISKDSKE